LILSSSTALAHDVYLAIDNHTDFGAAPLGHEEAMLAELDYYLAQIAATSANPPASQARFNADSWWYLRVYEQNRTPAELALLIEAIKSGHLTIPLNPFPLLYGAMPTEAAIRAGYYPGRIERRFDVPFLLAAHTDNPTMPWGLSSIWAGSGARYAWKGAATSYGERSDEVFRWQGPDQQTLLVKWYLYGGSVDSWGGYAEARSHLSESTVEAAIARFSGRPPSLPMTGLFGAGGDDLEYRTEDFVTLAQAFNASHANDRVLVSNELDYFQAVELTGVPLPFLRGGFGIDRDLAAASLAKRSGDLRRAVEALHGAESLHAVLHAVDPSAWTPQQAAIETGFFELFKYYEHTFEDAPLKQASAEILGVAVEDATGAAQQRFAAQFAASDQERFAVFNPLGFARTDYVDLPLTGSDPIAVTDPISLNPVPAQRRDGLLRVLVRDIPAYGYRVYTFERRNPVLMPNAAEVTARQLVNDRFMVSVGDRGEITDLFDQLPGIVEIAGDLGLNDFGSGDSALRVEEWNGPVSATMRVEIGGAIPRRTRITVFADISRVEIENEILSNVTGEHSYRFHIPFTPLRVHYEELGAIMRPGMTTEGGDHLPGARTDFLQLNHFVNLEGLDYNVTLSNRDAFAMQLDVGVPGEVRVLATGNPANTAITGQGNDQRFSHDFAIIPARTELDAAESMRQSLAHQNRLLPIILSKAGTGSIEAPRGSFLSIDAANVVITAFKPAEDTDRGFIVRAWELNGQAAQVVIDASYFFAGEAWETSLIETDQNVLPVVDGRITVDFAPNEMKTIRFLAGEPPPPTDAGVNEDAQLAQPDAQPPDPTDSGVVNADAAVFADAAMSTGPQRGEPGCGCRSSRGDTKASWWLVFVLLSLTRRRSIPNKSPLSWRRKQKS
jgi:alpha-mannosidase